MSTKREQILNFIISNEGATIQEIADKFNLQSSNVRQFISYLRSDGHEIKTYRYGNSKCSYQVIKVSDKKPDQAITDNVRVVLATLDEWTNEEIADICKVSTKVVSNTIGYLRRTCGMNIKTKKLSLQLYSYQLVESV